MVFYSCPIPKSSAVEIQTIKIPDFVGPVEYPTPNAWIQSDVIYKPNFDSVEQFIPKHIVYAQLVSTDTPLDPGLLTDGIKIGDGECVTFVKAYLGLTGTWGYGGANLTPNSPPVIGAVVLFYGHVAVIIGIQADGGLILIESNYHLNNTITNHTITMGRVVHIGDSNIRGYWVNKN